MKEIIVSVTITCPVTLVEGPLPTCISVLEMLAEGYVYVEKMQPERRRLIIDS